MLTNQFPGNGMLYAGSQSKATSPFHNHVGSPFREYYVLSALNSGFIYISSTYKNYTRQIRLF